MSDHIRLRKILDAPIEVPALPDGLSTTPLWKTRPAELHALLQAAYATGGGTVEDFDTWWWPLVEDEEFDPRLLMTVTCNERPVGLIQCWTSGFIKDLVVLPSRRNSGIGSFLLKSAFAHFRQNGARHVDLKVERSNSAGRRLYHRHGLEPTDSAAT